MRIDAPQVTSSLSLNGTTITDLNVFVTTGSLNGLTGSYATTGSNLFKGTQTLSGSFIPAVNNTYDLGSPTNQFRHVYISSGSLYVNGTKVLGSTSQELQITTDVGQSFKILETGADTITLQSADGNVTLTSTGQGDIVMDPNTGVIGLKGTVTIYTGNKITSSDGNAIQFGNGIAITGSIIATGTALVSGSSQITYSGLSGVPSNIISGSGQLTTLGIATTGSNTFNGNLTVTGFIDTQELRTTYISSSILYRSGSTKFGDELTDTHSFTGSILISGSISVPGSNLVSGSSQVLNGSGVFSGSAQLPSGIVSSSAQTIANLPSGVVSGSAQTIANLPSGTVSGSVQILNGTGFVKTSGASITYDNSTYLTTGTASSTYLPLAGGTLSGDIQMGSNQNRIIKFRTATAWDYSLRGVNDDFFITDNPGLNYLALYYNTGGNNRYTSLMGVFNVYASGAATFSSSVEAASFYTNDTRYIANQIQSGYNANSEDSDIWINYTGYQGGTTRFRDFRIGNGKQGQIAFFDGSTGGVTFSSGLTVNGTISTNSITATSLTGEASTTEIRLKGGGYGGSYNTSLRSITGAVGVLQFGNNGENHVLIGNTATSANTYLSFRVNSTTEATSSGTEAFRITSTGVGNSSISIPNGTLYMPSSIGGRTSQIEFGNLTSGDILGIPNATSTFYLSYGSGYIQFRNDAAGEVLRLKNDANVAVTNKLTVGGSIRASNSVYNWFQLGTNSWDGYQYLHLKTNMSSGANGNVDHTMSLFTGRLYSYSSAYIREGSFGFHNWSGGLYNPVLTGNFWAGGYGSSDGYVVLIVALGGGSYMGLNIDWHQSYPYGFRDRIVTSYNHSNSSASLY